MRKKLLLMFLLPICLFQHPAYAVQATTDLTLQVEGRAPVVQNDEARAREEAVKNALEKVRFACSLSVIGRKQMLFLRNLKSVVFQREKMSLGLLAD